MKPKSLLYLVGLVSLLTVVLWGFWGAPAEAQQVSPSAIITPTAQIEIPPPQVRTWQEMEAAAAKEAAGPPLPARQKIFRPTMGAAAYRALKAQAAQTPALQAPLAPSAASPAPLAATLTNPINFNGVDQAGAAGPQGQFYPPDTEGAVGLNHFVEITNTHLDIYEKAAPNTRVKSVTLASFFGYGAQLLFDPRVIYDAVSNRWIISADADLESAAIQRFFFAVSQTADPTGSFFIYNVNVIDPAYGINSFWDFPQVGLDANAVIFTANLFNGINFVGARMFTVAKSILYNGPSQTLTPTKLFTGLVGTLTPPIVLDTNANTYLVADNTPSSQVTLYTLTNSAGNPPTLSGPAAIPVTAFTVPPNVPQPGTTAVIDPSDGRFVNTSTQIGNSLFQVHTINIGGFARPRFYEFDTVNRVVIQSGTFARSSTSYDFNASIAANSSKDVFVNWSATDPTNSVNAEVRFSGRLHTDTPGVIPSPGSRLFGSTVALTGNTQGGPQRWGDYSAVSIDPADATGLTAWIVNETIVDASHWGSRIGSIKLTSPTPVHRSPTGAYLLLLLD